MGKDKDVIKVQRELFKQLLETCRINDRSGGGSGVRRLVVEGLGGEGRLTDSFFLRSSDNSFSTNVAIAELFRRATTAVCMNTAYRDLVKGGLQIGTRGGGGGGSPLPRVHVPQVFAGVDKGMGSGWEKALTYVRKKVRDADIARGTRNPNPWGQFEDGQCCAIIIVRGVSCTVLGEAFQDDQKNLPQGFNGKGHAAALGVIHALDMIVGNGDRLFKGNMGNFFVDDVGGLLAIDIDAVLVSMHRSMGLWRELIKGSPAEDQEVPSDEMRRQWPGIPFVVLPHFEPYTQNATVALQNHFDLFIAKVGRFNTPGANRYKAMMPAFKGTFVSAAIQTFHWLKENRNDMEFFPEELLCSRSSLKEKISLVMGV